MSNASAITLTEGPDVYNSTLRSSEDFLVFRVNMLGGDDRFVSIGTCSLDLWMGSGNDYAQINMMFNVWVHGEDGNDTVDVTKANYSFTFYGGGGSDRVNFLYDENSTTIDGGAGNDSFYGNNHRIYGTIGGGAGDDFFAGFVNAGNGYRPTLAGGTGNDIYRIDPASAPIIVEKAGEGIDTVELLYKAAYVLPANVENLVVVGASSPSTTITGNSSANVLAGGETADTITGLGGNDTLKGNGGNDKLYGGSGADLLQGDDGNDVLRGDGGRDQLWGGAGADTFVYNDNQFAGTTTATCEVIHDFSNAEGDRINLSLVDAKSATLSDDAFTFIGTGAFTRVAGQLCYQQIDGNTYVQGDTNGDGVADFWVRLDGLQSLTASDFFL